MNSLLKNLSRLQHSVRAGYVEKQILQIYVNGDLRKIEEIPSARTPLSQYLRSFKKETSVKLGCEEGGCGSCVVLQQKLENESVVSKSVNSCLVPLCSLHGTHIITHEGLRNHPTMNLIQENFVNNYASQCGFCTPGFEMTLFAYLLEQQHDFGSFDRISWSSILGGNLCRCTGYRPIIDACNDVIRTIQENGFEVYPLHLEDCYLSEELFGLINEHDSNTFVAEDGSTFFYPSDISELFDHKANVSQTHESSTKFLGGGSDGMLEKKDLQTEENMNVICLSGIKELEIIEFKNDHLVIGSSVTIHSLEKFLRSNSHEKSPHPPLIDALLDQISRFANYHVRQIATVGGNMVTASPTSDLNPIWIIQKANVGITTSQAEQRIVKAKDFFKSYRTVDLKEDEIVMQIEVPLTFVKNEEIEKEVMYTYKQSRRREDDTAIQNGAMRILFSVDHQQRNVVKECMISIGCVDQVSLCSLHLSQFLEGRVFDEVTFQQSLEYFKKDFFGGIRENNDTPGGMADYRRTLLLSHYFKFFRKCQNEIYGIENEDHENQFLSDHEEEVYSDDIKSSEFSSKTEFIRDVHSEFHATGEAKFIDDLPNLQDELFLGFVFSDRAIGTIKNIDLDRALSLDGVEGWADHRDVPGQNIFGGEDEELFVSEKVKTSGQLIGVVLASDLSIARKAAKLVEVEYVLEDDTNSYPIFSIDEAIEEESFFNFFPQLSNGDVEKAMSESDFKFRDELYIGGQEHFYMEPHTSICIPEEGNCFTVYSSTQNVYGTQRDIMTALNPISQNQIKVETKRVGGAFGGKETRASQYACVAAVASQKYGRPVRAVLDRISDMSSSGQRHPFKCEYEVGVMLSDDGEVKIHALDVRLYCNGGFSEDLSLSVMERAMLMFDNCYEFPNLRVQGFVCRTNLPSNTAMRGFGAPQSLLCVEKIMYDVSKYFCDEEGDLMDVRLSHMYDKTNQEDPVTPFGQSIADFDVMNEVMDEMIILSDFNGRMEHIQHFNSHNERRKRGLYRMALKFGVGFDRRHMNQGHSLVHVYRDGSVCVSTSGIELGQGLTTKIAKVTSESLDNLPIEKIRVVETSTSLTANGPPTAASCGSDLSCGATIVACKEIMENLREIRESVGYDAGIITWEELINLAYLERVQLSTYGKYDTPLIHQVNWDGPENATGHPFDYFVYLAACSEVEVDGLTGDCRVRRVDIVSDIGSDPIHAQIDKGQIEGGFIQGLGWILMEELGYSGLPGSYEWMGDPKYDLGVTKGNLISTGPGKYKIPTVDDIPFEMNIHILDHSNHHEINNKKENLDDQDQLDQERRKNRGVGEAPFVLANSVYFALREAIEEFRKEKVPSVENDDNLFHIYVPCTVEKIRMACLDEFTENILGKDEVDFIPDGFY